MDEQLAVLKFLANEYLVPRFGRRPPYNSFLNSHMNEEWHAQFRNLAECVSTAKFIYANTWREEDSASVLQPAEISKFVDHISTGLDFHNSVARTIGLFLCLDSHYNTIVKVIKPEYFPESEHNILRQLGYENPGEDLSAILFLMKERVQQRKSRPEQTLSEELDSTKVHLRKEAQAANLASKLSDEKSKFTRTPKWFKAAGQIAQGAALSIANLALALDILSLPVSPETKSYGALVSATTGVGQILSGIGDIRGE